MRSMLPWVRPNNIVVEAVAAVVEVEDAAGAEDLTVPRKVIMEIDHLHLPGKELGAQITTVLQINRRNASHDSATCSLYRRLKHGPRVNVTQHSTLIELVCLSKCNGHSLLGVRYFFSRTARLERSIFELTHDFADFLLAFIHCLFPN